MTMEKVSNQLLKTKKLNFQLKLGLRFKFQCKIESKLDWNGFELEVIIKIEPKCIFLLKLGLNFKFQCKIKLKFDWNGFELEFIAKF